MAEKVETVVTGQVEKVVRKRGWTIYRNYDYDMKDKDSVYFGVDEATWRAGIEAEWGAVGESDSVEWFIFIFHDNDWVIGEKDKDTGEVKPPYRKKLHAQGVIKYKNAKTQTAVMAELCGNNERPFNVAYVDPALGGYLSACKYLTHITQGALNEEKTWYHPTAVYAYKIRYLDAIKTNSKVDKMAKRDEKALADDLVNKIIEGEIRYYDAKAQFKQELSGAALVRFRSTFDGAFQEFREAKTKELLALSDAGKFKKRSRYITGASETGKSVLGAQLIVDAVGVGEVFKPGDGASKKITYDLADGYIDEKGTLLSDFDGTKFELMGTYNLLDPTNWSPSGSRNVVKPWFSTEVVIANAYSVGTFACRAINASADYRHRDLHISIRMAEEFRQMYRRFEQVLEYDKWRNPLTGEMEYGVMVYLRKEQMITGQELYAAYEKARKYRFDEKTSDYFFDLVGFVPYDPTWENNVQFREERLRIAKIINQVSRENLKTPGFVPGKPFVPMPIDSTQDDPIVPVRPAYSNNQLSIFA